MDTIKKTRKERTKGKKTLAKAVGVKSVFAVDDAVYMTSFGKGNDAVLEKKILGNGTKIDLCVEKQAFDLIGVSTAKYEVSGKRAERISATTDNPLHKKDSPAAVPEDMLCLKSALEMKYFGKVFDSDHLHIQLIYNILDIEKIIAQYVTNAVYAINNLFRAKGSENSDYVGSVSTEKPLEKNRNPALAEAIESFPYNPRLGYFGTAFYYRAWDREKNCYCKDRYGNYQTDRKPDDEIFAIIELLGSLRQWAFHGSESNFDPAWLYGLNRTKTDTEGKPDYKGILDGMYNEALFIVQDDFVSINKLNLLIIMKLYPNANSQELAKEYLNFLVWKEHKNMGFSIKKLREVMLNGTDLTSDPEKKNPKYDSVRSKLYKLIDFVLYRNFLHEDKESVERIVGALRATMTDEEKENVYKAEAGRLQLKYNTIIMKEIPRWLSRNAITELQKQSIPLENPFEKEDCDGSDVSYFTKLIYLLTLFLDGKEINDLLTTLIHKFDNIRSFLATMNDLKLCIKFVDDYGFFEGSDKIFSELVKLNSFAKMCPIDVSAKKIMYIDAIDILGIKSCLTEEELADEVDAILDINTKMGKKKTGMRNFIASNVIESNRFRYLVRYGNSKKIRKVANCGIAVSFVLKGIPDAQIKRYYCACFPEKKNVSDLKKMRDELAKQIGAMDFDDFRDAESVQNVNAGGFGKSAETKRRYQAIIRLYLTVMYLLLKNLVNVNARYVIGFYCLERDNQLYGQSNKDDKCLNLTKYILGLEEKDFNADGSIKCEYTEGREQSAKNRHLRKAYWWKLVLDNLKNSDNSVNKQFRNTVAHLNAIRNIDENIEGIAYINQYYDLYHYLIQKHLQKWAMLPHSKCGNKAKEYLKSFEKHRSYCKDWVKAYCAPMAYSLVRYKNLTIDGQFDKNFTPENGQESHSTKTDLATAKR